MTFLSVVLISLAAPPHDAWPLIWICLIPWFIALKRAPTARKAAIQGFWLSYLLSNGIFWWVASVLTEFGNLKWPIGFLGLQLFALFGQPHWIAFAWIAKKIEQRKIFEKNSTPLSTIGIGFSIAFLYTGLDWICPKLFLDTLGDVFYKARHLRQVADLGGPFLLTFLLFLVNDALWQNLKIRKLKLQPALAVALSLVLMGWTYGYFRYETFQKLQSQNHTGVQVAAIQGNIGDFEKISSEQGITQAATHIIDTFTQLTQDALRMEPRPQIILWPETSYPSTFRKPNTLNELHLDQRMNRLVNEIQVPLLFGGYDRGNHEDYNAFFFLSPNGTLQTYRKNILLLFGEYIPGADTIPLIKSLFPQVGNFGRGKGPEIFNISLSSSQNNSIRVAPIICYEALFSHFVAESARQGSQMIFNITNDSWFGTYGEPQLHLALSTFRSIETRLPMVRATNTGISALILADGEITHPTQIEKQQIMNVFVPILPPFPTLIKLWGDWFGIFAFCLGCLGTRLWWTTRILT